MFRPMRRSRQLLPQNETIEILRTCTAGVLAVSGDDGYPYAVPLSYVYDSGKILFHCAKSGHKLDAILKNEKVSFCVVSQDEILPEKFTTCFRSVIAFGRARVLDDPREKQAALVLLADKYAPGLTQARDEEISRQSDALLMVELTIEHMTGKEAIELTRRRS